MFDFLGKLILWASDFMILHICCVNIFFQFIFCIELQKNIYFVNILK